MPFRRKSRSTRAAGRPRARAARTRRGRRPRSHGPARPHEASLGSRRSRLVCRQRTATVAPSGTCRSRVATQAQKATSAAVPLASAATRALVRMPSVGTSTISAVTTPSTLRRPCWPRTAQATERAAKRWFAKPRKRARRARARSPPWPSTARTLSSRTRARAGARLPPGGARRAPRAGALRSTEPSAGSTSGRGRAGGAPTVPSSTAYGCIRKFPGRAILCAEQTSERKARHEAREHEARRRDAVAQREPGPDENQEGLEDERRRAPTRTRSRTQAGRKRLRAARTLFTYDSRRPARPQEPSKYFPDASSITRRPRPDGRRAGPPKSSGGMWMLPHKRRDCPASTSETCRSNTKPTAGGAPRVVGPFSKVCELVLGAQRTPRGTSGRRTRSPSSTS